MPLNINFTRSGATIKHLNLRKQGNEDDRVLAIDVKVEGDCSAEVLPHLLGLAPGEDARAMFWNEPEGEEAAPLITYAMDAINIKGKWPNRLVKLGKHKITADVGKVQFSPNPGHTLTMTASISIDAPAKELLDFLVMRLQDDVPCLIESQPELDLNTPAKAKA